MDTFFNAPEHILLHSPISSIQLSHDIKDSNLSSASFVPGSFIPVIFKNNYYWTMIFVQGLQ